MTTSIKVNRNVAAVCGESSRYALDCIQCTQGSDDTVWAVATDGRALSVARCEGEVDKHQDG